MKTSFLTLSIALFLSFNSFSQTVKDKIDKQSKDPATKENAAKADVYLQKNIIYDSSITGKTKTGGLKEPPKKIFLKKKKKKVVILKKKK